MDRPIIYSVRKMENYKNKIVGLSSALGSMLNRYRQSLLAILKRRKDSLKASTASASLLVPAVAKKPSVIWRWIVASYWFYISILIAVILMTTAVPSVVDATLAEIYPQIETKKLFGLIVQKSNDPRIMQQRQIILGILWVVSIGLSAYVLLLSLPGAVRKAGIKARQKENQADKLVKVKPSESILLYNKALKLTVDQNLESMLTSKIDTLDNVMKTGHFDQVSPSPPEIQKPQRTGTIMLPKEDVSDHSKQGNTIGPDGRYRIEKEIGRGAMGIVFLAKDQLLLRDVALKKLTSGVNQNQNIVTRFQQEARALAQLSHPNIIQIYDFVHEKDQYWIAMEHVEGKDLGSLTEESENYPVNDYLRICILVAKAMDYAHNRGVVHRDFKPSNVLVTMEGEPKVMDFGLAKLSHSSIATIEGSLLGSPAYMSPEQAKGETADARSDIYAMGVTLFQLITGELPFEGDLKSVITQKIAGRQPSVELLENKVPTDLVQIIKKMTATDPDDRPATMKTVSEALKRINKTDA